MIKHKRSVILILISISIIYFAVMIIYAFLPAYLEYLDTPVPMIQLTRSIFISTLFIFPSFIGKLSDKIQNRYYFILIGIIGMIGSIFLLSFTKNLILINILLFIFGFFASSSIILFTLYVELVQNDPKKISLYNACMAAGWFLGVQTGGILIYNYGIGHIFIYSLIPFMLTLVPVIFIKEDRQLILEQTNKISESNQNSNNEGEFVDKNPKFKNILSSLFFRSFGIRPILGTIVIIMGFHFTNQAEIGFLIGINPLMQFFLMILVGKIITKKNLKPLMLLGYILTIFIILGYIYSSNFWSFLIFQILVALSYSLFWMGSLTYIAQNSTPKNKGRYMGYANTSAFAGDSIGGIFFGLLLLIFNLSYDLSMSYDISMFFMVIFPVISLIIVSFRFNPYKKTMQGSKKILNSEGEH